MVHSCAPVETGWNRDGYMSSPSTYLRAVAHDCRLIKQCVLLISESKNLKYGHVGEFFGQKANQAMRADPCRVAGSDPRQKRAERSGGWGRAKQDRLPLLPYGRNQDVYAHQTEVAQRPGSHRLPFIPADITGGMRRPYCGFAYGGKIKASTY